MADPLSLAASIAGLVSLSGAVFQQVSKFVKEVKGAEKQVRDLALQARNLSGVLQNLSLLASSLEDENSKTTFKAHHLFACSQTLFDIEIKLKSAQDDFDKGSKAKSLLRSFRWPFSTEETKSLASDLANHCSTLDLALSAETLERLLQCLASQDEIKSGIKSLTQAVERISTIQTRVEMNKSRQEIVQFFLRVNPQSNYQTSMRLRQPLSGLWLTESDATFRKWRETPHSALWLSGIPGAGKTILCGVAIEDVLQLSSASTAVAFFFCDYKSSASQQLVNILCSIAVQLAQQNPTTFGILETYFKSLNPKTGLQQQPEVGSLHDVISQLTSTYEQVFLVVDGLDECGDNVEQVAAAITKIFEDCQSVSLAVFSRNEFEIREELEAYCSHIEIAAHREDLELYVRAEMSKRKQLKRLEVQNPALSEEIRVKLIDGAQGMFRWVTCQLDYLCDLNTNRARREALQSLPPTLEETYHRILQRVIQAGPQAAQLVQKTLHWTALGAELTLAQLQEGVSIPEEDVDDFGEDDLIEIDEIFRRCSSLVRKTHKVGAAGQVIDSLEFAHFTVEEYLVGIDFGSDVAIFKFRHEQANEQLLKTCMRSIFIMGGKFRQSSSQSLVNTNQRHNHVLTTFKAHPFYFYATTKLSGSNASNELLESTQLEEPALYQQTLCLFQPNNREHLMEVAIGSFFCNCSIVSYPDHFWFQRETFEIVEMATSDNFTPLMYAAALGLPDICSAILEAEPGVAKPTLQANLCCAIAGAHIFLCGQSSFRETELRSEWVTDSTCTQKRQKTIMLFLEHDAGERLEDGVSPEWPQLSGATPLHYAAICGNGSVVKILLANGHEPQAEDAECPFRSPLREASAQGNTHVVQIMRLWSPIRSLHSYTFSLEEARIVLSEDLDGVPSSPELHRAVALATAIRQRKKRIYEKILSDKRSVNMDMLDCSSCPRPPIVNVIQHRNSHCLDVLISNGASVGHIQCWSLPLRLRNIVSLAIWYQVDEDMLHTLLDESLVQGVRWIDDCGNPFHVASIKRNAHALRTLIGHVHVNFELYRKLYRHQPWFKGNSSKDFVSAALNIRASFVVLSELSGPLQMRQGTPLHYAVANHEDALVHVLITNGSDLDSVDEYLRTPSMLAAQLRTSSLLIKLALAGANQSMCDAGGRTALGYAIDSGNWGEGHRFGDDSLLRVVTVSGYSVLDAAVNKWPISKALFIELLAKGLDAHGHGAGQRSPTTEAFNMMPENGPLCAYILNRHLLVSVAKSDVGNPLAEAALTNRPGLLRRLIRFLGSHKMMERFLNRDNTVNALNSPLCNAVARDSVSCLEQLLDAGADLDSEGSIQGSALMIASSYGRLEVVKRLMRRGASISYTNGQGLHRNAFEAGRHHHNIKEWFLIGQFLDQHKIASEFHQGGQFEFRNWSGVIKVEWQLGQDGERRKHESSFDYIRRVRRMKEEVRGLVVV